MKKLIIPIALVVTLSLSGCGGSDDAPANEGSSISTNAAAQDGTSNDIAEPATSTEPAESAPAEDSSPPAGDSEPVDPTEPEVEVPAAPNLIGTWKQQNSNSDDAYQQATITGKTITIEWVSDGGNSTAIYWVGTFKAPKNADEPYSWNSKRDAEKTDFELLASGADTKEFTYKNDTISYEAAAMGQTMTVKLKKE